MPTLRRLTALGIALALPAPPAAAQQPPLPRALTYVIVHGAWGGAWDWRRVDSLLTARGHAVYRPTLTGLGHRVHLASPNIGLDTHIDDVVNTILWEQLRDVVLVGHSYGGMIITGVADRIPDRVRHLVYVDAFVPDSGESVLSLSSPEFAEVIRRSARDGFLVPFWVTSDSAIPRDVPQPTKTFTDTLRLVNASRRRLPATYILTVESDTMPDAFQRYAERAATRGWTVHRLPGDHVPERSQPGPLTELLVGIP